MEGINRPNRNVSGRSRLVFSTDRKHQALLVPWYTERSLGIYVLNVASEETEGGLFRLTLPFLGVHSLELWQTF